MQRKTLSLCHGLAGVLAAIALTPAVAQTPNVPNFGFSYRAGSSASVVNVDAGGLVAFPAVTPGTESTVTFIVQNRGDVSWRVTNASISDARFTINTGGLVDIPARSSGFLLLGFSAQELGTTSAILRIDLASGGQAYSATFSVTGTNVAPDFVVTYVMDSAGNQIAVNPNDSIVFPQTSVPQFRTATIIIVNRGSGTGVIRGVASNSEVFRVSGLPLLPSQVAPERDFRFSVTFTPPGLNRYNGALQIDTAAGPRIVPLEGEGVGAAFSYELLTGGQAVPVAANGSVNVPQTNAGETRTLGFRVRNVGNSPGRLNTITLTGAGYTLSDVPSLPVSIAQGDFISFTIVFAPRESGSATARLRIDGASIDLNAVVLGASYAVTGTVGSTAVPLAPGGTFTFPTTPVGSLSVVAFQIKNVGNAPGLISAIFTSGPGFGLQQAPQLPITLPVSETLEIKLSFTPSAITNATGALQIEDSTFNLRGIGSAPPPLPAVSIDTASDTAQPFDQPVASVSLSEPYPMDINGRLILSFTSDTFTDDPAIQFSTGGRTADFRIPANTTQAVFTDGARQIAFQTGTVAGKIVATTSFTVGSISVSPAAPPSKTILIDASEPKIRSVQIGARTANSFEVLIAGYATSRSVSQLQLRFASAPGAALQTTNLTVDVDAAFSTWYQSAASRTFGSQFTVSLNIIGSGEVAAVQSVSVAATNSKGTSQSVTANLR